VIPHCWAELDGDEYFEHFFSVEVNNLHNRVWNEFIFDKFLYMNQYVMLFKLLNVSWDEVPIKNVYSGEVIRKFLQYGTWVFLKMLRDAILQSISHSGLELLLGHRFASDRIPRHTAVQTMEEGVVTALVHRIGVFLTLCQRTTVGHL